MIYLIIFVLLFIVELLYIRIAKKYNIIDKPNKRSSHTQVTIRGGGVIFWVASLFYLFFNFSNNAIWFFAGMTIISLVSFIEDVVSLDQKTRLLAHLFPITCAFIFTNVFNLQPWWGIAIGYFLFIGIMNVYNFMDGINGLTGLYSIVVLAAFQYVNLYITPFVKPDAIWYPMIASTVFLFFNFRKQAKCFAGDVGSMGVAFWIVTLLLMLITETHSFIWLGFMMVYGVDSVCTILHRIYLKQNIMEAHRLHFYQVLANEQNIPQRLVSVIYFMVQLLVSVLIISLYPMFQWWVFVVPLIVLVGVYFLKFKMLRIGTRE